MSDRTATVSRDTLETQIKVSINLDGTGQSSFETGIPFLEHMLDQVARHRLAESVVLRAHRHSFGPGGAAYCAGQRLSRQS